MQNKHTSIAIIIALLLISIFTGALFTLAPASALALIEMNGLTLTRSEYSHIYILMISGAIFASYFSSKLSVAKGLRFNLILASLFSLLGVMLFIFCFVLHDKVISYTLLLGALFFNGLGYGLMTSTLAAAAFVYLSKGKEAALSALFIAGALGAMMSFYLESIDSSSTLIFLQIALALSFLCVACMAPIIFPSIKKVQLKQEADPKGPLQKKRWIGFIFIALFYGFCETIINVWGSLFLHTDKQMLPSLASGAIALFWISIFLGRSATFFLLRTYALERLYPLYAFAMAVGFALLFFSKSFTTVLISCSILGLAMGPCLPLILSWSQRSFTHSKKTISSQVITSYLIGFSLSSFGISTLERGQAISLSSLMASGIWASLILCMTALIVLKKGRVKKEDFEF